MLSIELCEKILSKNGNSYSKSQVGKMREFFYQLATIEYQEYKTKKDGNKCSVIHKSFNR